MSDPNPYASPQPVTEQEVSHPPLGWQTLVARSVQFGLLSGFLWSLIPAIWLHGGQPTSRMGVISTLAGIVTGILVSLILAPLLTRVGYLGAAVVGVLSYPLSTFLYGFVITWIQFGLMSGGTQAFRSNGGGFAPIMAGTQYAFLSLTIWPLCLLAITTTLALQAWLKR